MYEKICLNYQIFWNVRMNMWERILILLQNDRFLRYSGMWVWKVTNSKVCHNEIAYSWKCNFLADEGNVASCWTPSIRLVYPPWITGAAMVEDWQSISFTKGLHCAISIYAFGPKEHMWSKIAHAYNLQKDQHYLLCQWMKLHISKQKQSRVMEIMSLSLIMPYNQIGWISTFISIFQHDICFFSYN
jgi:hypothetical protein